MDESLTLYLEHLNIYETQDVSAKKENAISRLEDVATKWVCDTVKRQNIRVQFSPSSKPCTLFLQGSYVLGVSFKWSDVDAVLVVPNFIDREEFFGAFYHLLAQHRDVENLIAVPDTYVPVIRMTFSGVPIDLVLSQLSTSYVRHPLNLSQHPADLYAKLDPICIRGLSGVHASRTLLNLVPCPATFKAALKAIRAWAVRRGISEYVYGFPSSIGLAIMVAYVCKKIDDSAYLADHLRSLSRDRSAVCGVNYAVLADGEDCGNQVVRLLVLFFALFSNWAWPEPVKIAPIQIVPELGNSSWDPKRNATDDRDLMPIITPVYPNKNAAFTARKSTRAIFVSELVRGNKLLSEIILGSGTWDLLFEEYNITDHFRHFVMLHLRATSRDDLCQLKGLIDSRLRDLAQGLEDDPNVVTARIAALGYPSAVAPSRTPLGTANGASAPQGDDPHETSGSEKSTRPLEHVWLIGMDIPPSKRVGPDGKKVPVQVEITQHVSSFYQTLRQRAVHADVDEKLTITYRKKAELLRILDDLKLRPR